MQKDAARQEALSVKDTEVSKAAPASAGGVAAEGSVEAEAAAEPAGADTPAEEPPTAGADSGGAAAGRGEQRQRAGGAADTADGGDAAELEEEVKSLRKVIADLAERGQELQALQEQVRQRPDTCVCGICAGAAPRCACARPALVRPMPLGHALSNCTHRIASENINAACMAFVTKGTSGPAADDNEAGITAGSDGGLTERRRCTAMLTATVQCARTSLGVTPVSRAQIRD